jgi:hypothetical protein
MAVKKGAVFVRWVLIAVVVISALDLFGMINLLTNLVGQLS